MKNTYFEEKKRKGYIFTEHSIDPRGEFRSIYADRTTRAVPVDVEGPSFWSRLSGRYRTYLEQQEFIAGGLIDKKLPPIA